jgi:RNA polymerase sigma factor (TIGR02999 family)
MGEVTLLIGRAREGDRAAANALFRAVYDDLHRLAARQAAGAGPAAHGSTSLVHEAYFRLARPEALALNDRRHFFAVAARAMRQIAVDRARERLAIKRGAGAPVTTLGAVDAQTTDDSGLERLLDLDEAMKALEASDERLARLIELRHFSGMQLDEAGEVLGLSEATLKRDYRKARAFLHARLGGTGLPDEPGS